LIGNTVNKAAYAHLTLVVAMATIAQFSEIVDSCDLTLVIAMATIAQFSEIVDSCDLTLVIAMATIAQFSEIVDSCDFANDRDSCQFWNRNT
jgi:hypothetical protein